MARARPQGLIRRFGSFFRKQRKLEAKTGHPHNSPAKSLIFINPKCGCPIHSTRNENWTPTELFELTDQDYRLNFVGVQVILPSLSGQGNGRLANVVVFLGGIPGLFDASRMIFFNNEGVDLNSDSFYSPSTLNTGEVFL